MQIAVDKVVHIHYVLRNSTGDVLDASTREEPFAYLQGHGNIIQGLEKAMLGRSIGDAFEVIVQPQEGYGARDEGLVQTVPRTAFAGVPELEIGMQFHAESDDGMHLVTITAVDEHNVTVDGNHPLAGEVLTFQVEVTEIRDATAEELGHGHVHGPGGHHHHG